MMRSVALALTATAILFTSFSASAAPVWDDDIVALFKTLPVQDDGRVKPLDTIAQFTMLRMVGKRSLTLESGEKLDHMQWYLNCLFYPEEAMKYEHFIVDNSDAVISIGVTAHDKKRDRYSYNELKDARAKLFELAGEYSKIERAKRAPTESQIINLANNFHEFETLIHFFDAAFLRLTVTGDTETARAFPEAEGVPISTTLERVPSIMMSLREKRDTLSEEQLNQEVAALGNLMEQMRPIQMAMALALFPPPDRNENEWRTPSELFDAAMQFNPMVKTWLPLLASLEKLPTLRDDRVAFTSELAILHKGIEKIARDRGEYSKVPLEVHFYDAQYLYYSQVLFVLSFFIIAITWLLPRSKWTDIASYVAVSIPLILLIIGITLRCIIRSRPPISTLYETVLFITAVAVLTAIIAERLNKERIAIAVASILGCMGMFLAFRYEAKEGVDTMPSLVAVLDTNFWLATHVTIINAGYAASLLSGALGHVYIVGTGLAMLGIGTSKRNFYRGIAKMTYGVLCFGLVFSVVGTILGGVWANDSWGRFWGWDPKENGALLICIWSLIALHAKMGLYIRELGMAICAVVLDMIVVFSWWGVNNLGVGLHSYGFTDGLWLTLSVFWAIEAAFVVLGLWLVLLQRWLKPKGTEVADAPAT